VAPLLVQERTLRKILVIASIVELGTGVALLADPTIVVRLLLGGEISDMGTVLGRCFGIALVAVALACWPGRSEAVGGATAAFRAMLTYNALIALYLAVLGTGGHMKGMLLWPAVALHVAVALLLVWARRPSNARESHAPI
jgi:hypothetical protein